MTGLPIGLPDTHQGGALGSAMHAAVAAGRAAGGYNDIREAAAAMARLQSMRYTPDAAAHAAYDALFAEYVTLHDTFGRGANDVMKRLKARRLQVKRR